MLLLALFATGQSIPMEPAAKLFPERLGDFRAAGPAVAPTDMDTSGVSSIASRAYVTKDGQKFWLTLMTAPSNSGAYALLTHAKHSSEKSERANVGTAGFQLG